MKWLIIKLKNPIKTCVSDCDDCFTVMLSRCSKHSKLSHIFLVMYRNEEYPCMVISNIFAFQLKPDYGPQSMVYDGTLHFHL